MHPIQMTMAPIKRPPAKDFDDLPDEAPRDAVKVDFARRLQRLLVRKGWNQSEFARRVQDAAPEGVRFARDHISTYMRGRSLPDAVRLDAIAKVLGVSAEDLLPTRGLPVAARATPPLDVRDSGDGNAWLRVNQSVPWDKALQIVKLLKG